MTRSLPSRGFAVFDHVLSRTHRKSILYQLCQLSRTGKLEGAVSKSPRAQMFYSPAPLEAIVPIVRTQLSAYFEESVVPTYSWLWLYCQGAELERHIDRASSEIVAVMTIDMPDESIWEIGFRPQETKPSLVAAKPGQLVVFEGRKTEHWREGPLKSRWYLQAVFNFVRESGPLNEHRFDGRPHLGCPPVPQVIQEPVVDLTIDLPSDIVDHACGVSL